MKLESDEVKSNKQHGSLHFIKEYFHLTLTMQVLQKEKPLIAYVKLDVIWRKISLFETHAFLQTQKSTVA